MSLDQDNVYEHHLGSPYFSLIIRIELICISVLWETIKKNVFIFIDNIIDDELILFSNVKHTNFIKSNENT